MRVEPLAERFAVDNGDAAAKIDSGRMVGVVTRTDIIDFLARKFNA